MLPQVDQSATADFFDMDPNKNAFSQHLTGGTFLRGRFNSIPSGQSSVKSRVTCKDDLDEVSESIEAKYMELKHKMEEAKQAQAKKKTTKILKQISKIATNKTGTT